MNSRSLEKLDNPVWFSLAETHRQFSIAFENARFYHPDYCPFGAMENPSNITGAVNLYSKLTKEFYIVARRPELQGSMTIMSEFVCLQMMIERPVDIDMDTDIVRLGAENATEVFELVNLVQPDYFRARTQELGNYYGIFENKRLVAVTGERMKMENLTEISAVVTHPDHSGKGHAKQLVTFAVGKILERGETPFLHVAESNKPAIGLYEKLGFTTRRTIRLWKIGEPRGREKNFF